MIGAILGDIIGSRFEFSVDRKNKSENFDLFTEKCYFTDDTVLTIATADALLNNQSFEDVYHYWGNKYPNAGYGGMFDNWLSNDDKKPYNSFGNGSAMRISPIGWLYNDLEMVFQKAEESASVTHNHSEGIKGAMATATCIYLARYNTKKKIIKDFIQTYFDYNLNRSIEDIRPTYTFDVTCQGSVPEAIICFLEGKSFEDVIRKAVSLGGDTDTQACIAGSIAEAYYSLDNFKLNYDINGKLAYYLPGDMLDILVQFENKIS